MAWNDSMGRKKTPDFMEKSVGCEQGQALQRDERERERERKRER